MQTAAARTMKCYGLDGPNGSIEETLDAFDFPLFEDGAPPIARCFLDDLGHVVAAQWLRAFWIPQDLARRDWPEWFGADHAWWT